MKRKIKKIIIIILVATIAIMVYKQHHVNNIYNDMFENNGKMNDSEGNSNTDILIEPIKSNKEIIEEWKNTSSDIEGWTIYDKYKYGLDVWDNSDTDGDGLTDKEEIEIYDSDPLKAVTSKNTNLSNVSSALPYDNLSDGYKVENGLDVHQIYDDEKYNFEETCPNNECPEISPLIEDISWLDVTIKPEDTSSYKIKNYDILAAYSLSKGGISSIDFTTIFDKYDLSADDINIIVYDGKISYPKYKFYDQSSIDTFASNYTMNGGIQELDINTNTAVINYNFDKQKSYKIFVVKKNLLSKVETLFNSDNVVTYDNRSTDVNSVIFGSPILSLFGKRMDAYSSSDTNSFETDYLLEADDYQLSVKNSFELPLYFGETTPKMLTKAYKGVVF